MDMMIDPHMTPRKLTNLRSNPMLREMRVKPLLLREVEPSANVILDKKDNRVAPELQDSRTFRTKFPKFPGEASDFSNFLEDVMF